MAFHEGQISVAHHPTGALGQRDVHGEHVGPAEQFGLGDGKHAVLGGALGAQVRRPRDHRHAEGLCQAGHRGAEASQSEHAEGRPLKAGADGVLPAAHSHGGVLLREVPGQRDDHADGEFRHRIA